MDNLEEMEKFLEKLSLLRLNQEKVENINRPNTSTEIETVTQNLPKNKSLGTNDFPGEFYQTFREELILILLKLFQKNSRKETPKLILYGCHHPDTKTKDTTKGNLHASITDAHKGKNP